MIKAIIIEDEDIAAIKLQKMIQDIDGSIQIQKIISSVKDSVVYLSNNQPDLIFLDINLSDNNSFEIFNQVPDIKSKIIFTTAYSEYAIKAFELNSIDYLLKPISKETLERSIQKLKSWDHEKTPNYKDIFLDNGGTFKKRFLIKLNNSLISIEIDEVAYFYSDDKVTFIKLKNDKNVPIDYSLKKLEELLNPVDFYRVNRKYIVHISSIKKMYYSSKSKIILHLEPTAEDDHISVPIEKIGQFKKWLSI
ncbi:LytR/AlgR family response regulator transcription factor [Aquimarina pacifica]|uniref:LytR/AlgR family response regulator transcription factor n=1 Tax=Aquimarina pacifica TaxID=1296415 RepID=UPI0004B52D35|nr:LytTR family DNA-binding domain-containing protein [Aquimarina pacifica]